MQPSLQWKSGKYSIICCECVFVAVGVQHAMRMRPVVIFGLPGSEIFLHFIS